jgi:hypothetical protein
MMVMVMMMMVMSYKSRDGGASNVSAHAGESQWCHERPDGGGRHNGRGPIGAAVRGGATGRVTTRHVQPRAPARQRCNGAVIDTLRMRPAGQAGRLAMRVAVTQPPQRRRRRKQATMALTALAAGQAHRPGAGVAAVWRRDA